MDLLVILLVLGVVVLVVTAPLRAGRDERAAGAEASEREELEALKEAKYREIRDAELDHRTGKLSAEDWRTLDRRLRAEAMELLRRLDDVDPPTSGVQPR